MDHIDRKIIRELQQDARLTNQEISERVHLSPSPCLRRIRKLEESHILRGYTAMVDQKAYGLPITAFIMVRLERQNESTIKAFEEGINRLDEVMACYLMSGNQDYLLQVLAPSFEAYEMFIRERLTRIPGLGTLETHFTFGQVKRHTVFPEL